MELKGALATNQTICRIPILMRDQLHDLEMEYVRSLLRFNHFNLYTITLSLE